MSDEQRWHEPLKTLSLPLDKTNGPDLEAENIRQKLIILGELGVRRTRAVDIAFGYTYPDSVEGYGIHEKDFI